MTLSQVWETDPKKWDRGQDLQPWGHKIGVCNIEEKRVCVSIPNFSWMTHLGSFTYYYPSIAYEDTHTNRWIGLVWCPCQMSGGRWDRMEGGRSRLFPSPSEMHTHTGTRAHTHMHTWTHLSDPLRWPVTERVVSMSVSGFDCLTSANTSHTHMHRDIERVCV